MQDKNGLCSLHDRGLKPVEGRVVHHAFDGGEIHLAVAQTWATAEGKRVVARWCNEREIDSGAERDALEVLGGLLDLIAEGGVR